MIRDKLETMVSVPKHWTLFGQKLGDVLFEQRLDSGLRNLHSNLNFDTNKLCDVQQIINIFVSVFPAKIWGSCTSCSLSPIRTWSHCKNSGFCSQWNSIDGLSRRVMWSDLCFKGIPVVTVYWGCADRNIVKKKNDGLGCRQWKCRDGLSLRIYFEDRVDRTCCWIGGLSVKQRDESRDLGLGLSNWKDIVDTEIKQVCGGRSGVWLLKS